MRYGFVDEPDVGADLKNLIFEGVSFDPDHTTFFLGRERIGIKGEPNLRRWRQHLFGFMLRNAGDPSSYFGLPSNRCIDLGTHVDI